MQSEHDDRKSLEDHSKYSVAHIDHETQSDLNVQDEALKVLAHAQDQPPITPEEERALLRKVDVRVIPMLFITTGLQFADKSSLSTAALFGLVQSLKLYTITLTGLDTYRYSQAAMIFGVGYIAGVLPLALIAQRFPTGRVCALYVVLWGICVILTPLCKTFEGLMAQRFFLGFMESGVSPAFLSVLVSRASRPPQSD
jgi:MFS family permease